MITSILTALLLVSPPASRVVNCTDWCREDEAHVLTCFYTPRYGQCLKRELPCEESEWVDCEPRVLNLGTWDPVPLRQERHGYY